MTFPSDSSPTPDEAFRPDELVVKCSSCRRIVAAEDALNTCANCHNDLSNTEAVLYRSLAAISAAAPPTAAPEVGAGAGAACATPDTSALCFACQQPVDEEVDALCPHCLMPVPPVLMLVVGERRERLRSGDVLGRAGTVAADLFSPILEVSRQHARIVVRNGAWIVEALSASNVTRLDGRVIPKDAATPLTGRHKLSMSSRCDVVLELMCNGDPGDGNTWT